MLTLGLSTSEIGVKNMNKKIACFSSHDFETKYLELAASELGLEIKHIPYQLNEKTYIFAEDADAILCWANDTLDAKILNLLKKQGVKMISLRTAGYSHIDFECAKELGFCVTRVPSYSPESIAEHAVALLMSLNRKLIKAHQRIRDFNFTLDGLEGFQVFGKTVGVIGAGSIGKAFVNIMSGFGCKVLIYDKNIDPILAAKENVQYCELEQLLAKADILSLHCPLVKDTHHILNAKTLALMKKGSFIINTGRGGLIKTDDLINSLKEKKFGGVALDVYEFEEGIFFNNYSDSGINDDKLARLMTFPNVLITSHQAFFTKEALENIANTSLKNSFSYLTGNTIEEENQLI